MTSRSEAFGQGMLEKFGISVLHHKERPGRTEQVEYRTEQLNELEHRPPQGHPSASEWATREGYGTPHDVSWQQGVMFSPHYPNGAEAGPWEVGEMQSDRDNRIDARAEYIHPESGEKYHLAIKGHVPYSQDYIHATHVESGEKAGSMSLHPEALRTFSGRLTGTPAFVDVHEDHRNRGLARAMFRFAQYLHGGAFHHSDIRTEDGRGYSARVPDNPEEDPQYGKVRPRPQPPEQGTLF